jgi:hypothetical protein
VLDSRAIVGLKPSPYVLCLHVLTLILSFPDNSCLHPSYSRWEMVGPPHHDVVWVALENYVVGG